MSTVEKLFSEPAHPVDVHVGHTLRIIRKRAGVSQTALAMQLGLSFQQVQKYERGSNRISASKLWEISQFLHVTVNAFYEGLEGAPAAILEADLAQVLATPDGLALVRLLPRVPPGHRARLLSLVESMAS